MGGKNEFHSCPLHTAVKSLILNKEDIKTFWCNLNLIFSYHPVPFVLGVIQVQSYGQNILF